MQATAAERLSETEVSFHDGAACCVVMASNGYPGSYETGFPITIPSSLDGDVFVAGAKLKDDQLVTSGGRVLGVTAVGDSIQSAIQKAYEQVSQVNFTNAYFRTDIGQKALQAETEV